MTERLRLPEALAGPYEHAVICTYGADLRHLLVVGQVHRQDRAVMADHPAQALQAGVAA